MEKTTRIVIETKNFRFGYEKVIKKPEPKKELPTSYDGKGKLLSIRA